MKSGIASAIRRETQSELVAKSPLDGAAEALARLWMAAACVAPRGGPGRLGRSASGDEHAAVGPDDVAREAEVQWRAAPVDRAFRRRAGAPSEPIEEDDTFAAGSGGGPGFPGEVRYFDHLLR